MQEVLPPQTERGAGFEPTRVRQFTVFMPNRVGRMQALVRALEEAEQTILSLSVQNSVDTALVRMICSDADLASDVLELNQFSFAEQDVLVVELPPRARHPLATLCTALLAAEIGIHYAYPLLARPAGPAVALYVDDPVLAAQLLIRKGFVLLGESDLRKL